MAVRPFHVMAGALAFVSLTSAAGFGWFMGSRSTPARSRTYAPGGTVANPDSDDSSKRSCSATERLLSQCSLRLSTLESSLPPHEFENEPEGGDPARGSGSTDTRAHLDPSRISRAFGNHIREEFHED